METVYFFIALAIALVGGTVFIYVALKAVKVTDEFDDTKKQTDDLKKQTTEEIAELKKAVYGFPAVVERMMKLFEESGEDLDFARGLREELDRLQKQKRKGKGNG